MVANFNVAPSLWLKNSIWPFWATSIEIRSSICCDVGGCLLKDRIVTLHHPFTISITLFMRLLNFIFEMSHIKIIDYFVLLTLAITKNNLHISAKQHFQDTSQPHIKTYYPCNIFCTGRHLIPDIFTRPGSNGNHKTELIIRNSAPSRC